MANVWTQLRKKLERYDVKVRLVTPFTIKKSNFNEIL